MVRKLFQRDAILLAAICAAMAYLPYRVFDRLDLGWILLLEAMLLALGFKVLTSYRRALLCFVLMLITFCIACEGYIRVSSFGWDGLSMRNYAPAAYGNPLADFEYSDETYTGLKPQTEVMFKTRPFRVNDRGFRGPSFSEAKPEGTRRIVIAGASATLGTGVHEHERFTSLLESWLNESADAPRIEMINLSIPGTHIGNHLHVIREEGLRYDPDVVMLLINRANSSRKPLVLKPRKARAFDVSSWRLVTDCRYEFFRNRFFFARLLLLCRRGKLYFGNPSPLSSWLARLRGTGKQSEEHGLTPEDFAAMEQAYAPLLQGLQQLREMCPDKQIILYHLKPMDRGGEGGDARYREFISRQAARLDMAVLDAYAVDFSAYSVKDLVVYPGDLHPNATVHRLYAESISSELKEVVFEKP